MTVAVNGDPSNWGQKCDKALHHSIVRQSGHYDCSWNPLWEGVGPPPRMLSRQRPGPPWGLGPPSIACSVIPLCQALGSEQFQGSPSGLPPSLLPSCHRGLYVQGVGAGTPRPPSWGVPCLDLSGNNSSVDNNRHESEYFREFARRTGHALRLRILIVAFRWGSLWSMHHK